MDGGHAAKVGGSRAAMRRQKKKAKQAPAAPICEPSSSTTTTTTTTTLPPAAPANNPDHDCEIDSSSNNNTAQGGGLYKEWQLPMPADGPLRDSIDMALSEASSITGRKYRYGALLVAGEDLIPMKSGSNKKIFQRDEIHAEMSVLKGCPRPAGKDMVIGRLAPVKPSRKSFDGEEEEEEDVDDDDRDEASKRGQLGKVEVEARPSKPHPLVQVGGGSGGVGKILNARPCARCEMKMVERGVRRCYFTLNRSTVGVLEYNPDAF